jgi:hypothetical protein
MALEGDFLPLELKRAAGYLDVDGTEGSLHSQAASQLRESKDCIGYKMNLDWLTEQQMFIPTCTMCSLEHVGNRLHVR